ncbi:MAG: ATP-binding protein [Clostridia bacterium]|nr:ATP-binding protein [Clostridia bacterium]
MKQRVAIAATLTILLLMIVFLGLVAGFARDRLNEDASGHLSALCRLSAAQLDNAASANNDEYLELLRSSSLRSDYLIAVYSDDGQTDFTNMPQISDALLPEEREAARDVDIYSFSRNARHDGSARIYCVKMLASGSFLCISMDAFTLFDALGDYAPVFIGATVLVAAGVLSVMIIANNRTDRLVRSVLHVLKDFSDGNYDSRITGNLGDSAGQVAKCNEVLSRIEDQVFRQRTRNQALSAVLYNMQSGILAVDARHNVLLATPVARELLGISGHYEGAPLLMPNSDIDLDEIFDKSMAQDGVTIAELTAHTAAAGAARPLKLYISPVMKEGRVDGAVALIEDVTELRRLEQVRTDFAANVSHEMKTPLTSIKGFVETLLNGALDNPEMAKKFLNIIMLEADRLTRLINDILTVSKLESGMESVINEPVRLDEIIDDVIVMLELVSNEKRVSIKYAPPPEAVYVMGNRDRVEQMLINLIDNAIKYNKEGGLVTVSLFATGERINLSISDTGIGIPKDNIPRLFERFYRVDKGRSRSMGGTGLGLSIVKHIVKSMGGMIEVHSQLGAGTEFLLTFRRIKKAA